MAEGLWSEGCHMWRSSGWIRTHFGQVGLTNVCRSWTKSVQCRPDHAQIWPDHAQINSLDSCQVWPFGVEVGPKLVEACPGWAEIGRTLVDVNKM